MIATPPATPHIAVSFARLPPGWRRFPSLGGALATSWAYRPGPTGWATAMPPNGIAVNIFFVRDRPAYPPLRLRLPVTTRFALEGTPGTPEYRIRGRVAGRNVEVRVDIRDAHPSRARLRLAQRVVAAVRFR